MKKRADGIKLKGMDPFEKAMPYFMPHRYDAMNMITLDIPLEPIKKYLNERRFKKPTTHLAVIIAAIVRTISQFPELNRFVVNRKYYARNELTVSMVVLKKDGSLAEAMNKMYFEPNDTIDEITDKINKYIEDNSSVETEKNATDKALDILCKIPGLFSNGIKVLRWADKHNFLPKGVIDASPFHATVLITNLSSIRTRHIYHHVYDFGTTGLGMAIGTYRYKTEVKKGETVTYKTIPLGLTMDERVASGAYFALAFKEFEKYCKNPKLLEEKPERIVLDPNIKVK